MTYELSLHATGRIELREITADEIICALGRGAIWIIDAALASYYDRLSRVVVVVNVEFRRIVTVWRV